MALHTRYPGHNGETSLREKTSPFLRVTAVILGFFQVWRTPAGALSPCLMPRLLSPFRALPLSRLPPSGHCLHVIDRQIPRPCQDISGCCWSQISDWKDGLTPASHALVSLLSHAIGLMSPTPGASVAALRQHGVHPDRGAADGDLLEGGHRPAPLPARAGGGR